MRLRIAPFQIQKTILAPSMQQSIEVLLLPIQELQTSIEQQMQDNPLLELNEDNNTDEDQSWEKQIQKQLEKIAKDSFPTHSEHYAHDEDSLEEKPIKKETAITARKAR